MPARPAPSSQSPLLTARGVAADALAHAAAQFPDLPPTAIDASLLDARDARLAQAIVRHAVTRWLTIEHLLNHFLRQPFERLEPSLRGVLLGAAAQLLFMDRLPRHAVVDESVELARAMVRPKAAAMVNAVLRRLADTAGEVRRDAPWSAAADIVPIEGGGVRLRAPLLPPPDAGDAGATVRHLSVAASMPAGLLQQWFERFGLDGATRLCLHGLHHAPLIVATEGSAAPELSPHERPGFAVWRGDHASLVAALRDHPAWRVQDPTAAMPVAATAHLAPGVIVDYCAGRGTKTRQAAQLHPAAQIIATDANAKRVHDLRRQFTGADRVTVADLQTLPAAVEARTAGRGAGLVILDVPCTNTGVLARRPEARYRYGQRSLRSLLALQQKIIGDALPLLAPGGAVLYSTCSIEPAENGMRAMSLLRRGFAIVNERETLPGGEDVSYHDGGYFALLGAKQNP